jgi:hypothetical protein
MLTATEIIQQVEAEMQNFQNQWWSEYDSPHPPHLYHYTSLEGLVGILTTRKFFLSDVLVSSDRSEIHHGFDLATEVLRSKAGHALCASVLETLLNNPLLGIGENMFVYAVCFCPGSDVLTQWRAYSVDGGFAMGVDFGRILTRAAAAEFAISKMLYDHRRQTDLLKSTLDHATQLFDRLNQQIGLFPPSEAQECRNRFTFEVGMSLVKSILRFKNEAFQSENEWRILKLEARDDPKRELPRFRARGRTVIPYIELPFSPDLVTNIYRSPGPWPQSIEYGMRCLATSIGPHVICETSRLPL